MDNSTAFVVVILGMTGILFSPIILEEITEMIRAWRGK